MRVNIEKIFYQFFGGDVPQLEVHVDIGSDRDKPPPADKDEARDVHGRGQNDGHNFDKKIAEKFFTALRRFEVLDDWLGPILQNFPDRNRCGCS